MNINGINRNSTLGGVYDSQVKENHAKQEKTAATKKTDKIEISDKAKNLNIIDFSVSKVKDDIKSDTVSVERLNKLRESIKAGTYKPDSRNIANALMNGVFAE